MISSMQLKSSKVVLHDVRGCLQDMTQTEEKKKQQELHSSSRLRLVIR